MGHSYKRHVRGCTPYEFYDEPKESALKVYLSSIRPVMEYAVPVWQLIPGMLADNLESVQKRTQRIIFPSMESYNDALQWAELDSLPTRRH